jgi:hypothetical protein
MGILHRHTAPRRAHSRSDQCAQRSAAPRRRPAVRCRRTLQSTAPCRTCTPSQAPPAARCADLRQRSAPPVCPLWAAAHTGQSGVPPTVGSKSIRRLRGAYEAVRPSVECVRLVRVRPCARAQALTACVRSLERQWHSQRGLWAGRMPTYVPWERIAAQLEMREPCHRSMRLVRRSWKSRCVLYLCSSPSPTWQHPSGPPCDSRHCGLIRRSPTANTKANMRRFRIYTSRTYRTAPTTAAVLPHTAAVLPRCPQAPRSAASSHAPACGANSTAASASTDCAR